MSEPRFDIYDLRTRDAVWQVWRALPWAVRQRLDGITIKAAPHDYGAPGSAGTDDVWLKLPLPRGLDCVVVAHELAHVYKGHVARMARGELSAAQAEVEADALAAAWGFGR